MGNRVNGDKDMGSHWRNEAEDVLVARASVIEGPLASALMQFRTVVPALVETDDTDADALLRWAVAPTEESPPLSSALWEFMSLDGAPHDEIRRFARRYGPLWWPDEIAVATPSSPLQIEEPVWAWRTLARGFVGLFGLLTDESRPAGFDDADAITWAVAAIAVPFALGSEEDRQLSLTEWATVFPMRQALGSHSSWSGVIGERLMEALLEVSDVKASYTSRRRSDGALDLLLPARWVGEANSWRVQGLLSLLAASLAIAVRTDEAALCSRCGKPARIVSRKPQAGRPFYGDHEICRTLARGETMLRAERKRTEKRRRLAE